MVQLYAILSTLLHPFLHLYLLLRVAKNKEDAIRYKERLGIARFARPSGTLLWFHAASVGESISILPLIEALVERYPQIRILLTTGTVTSAHLIEKRLPEHTFHHFVPLDSAIAVRRFLTHFTPDLAIWVESELWPNLVHQTANHCPLLLINARISQDALNFWKRYPSISKSMVESFSLILPQSEEDTEHYAKLGATHLHYVGNLKFDSPVLPADSKIMGSLVTMIGHRPIWVAASTHAGEEEEIAACHLALKEEYPELLTIIIPRHMQRGKEVASILKQRGLSYALRSKEEAITENIDCYIADSMGELGIFYRLSPIVFIGGSLIAHGGQNPLEAARLECALIAGPHMENFSTITKELEEQHALIRVKDKTGLIDTVSLLLHNIDKQEEMAKNALKLVQSKSGIISAVIEQLTPYITETPAHKDAE